MAIDRYSTGYRFAFPSAWDRIRQRLGLTNSRNLFWIRARNLNFGDWIGPYLYKARTGRNPLYFPGANQRVLFPKSTTLWSVGSILRKITNPNCAKVWGSGILASSESFARPLSVLAVRGPRSANRLDELSYPNTRTFGDPGILLPKVYQPKVKKCHSVAVIPHFYEIERIRSLFKGREDIYVIDVRRPVENVVNDICAAEATISSSLHGVIVSHSYGVPSVWWASSDSLVGEVKFQDYFESLGETGILPVRLNANPTISELHRLVSDFATLPDVNQLSPGLIRCCPFWNL